MTNFRFYDRIAKKGKNIIKFSSESSEKDLEFLRKEFLKNHVKKTFDRYKNFRPINPVGKLRNRESDRARSLPSHIVLCQGSRRFEKMSRIKEERKRIQKEK